MEEGAGLRRARPMSRPASSTSSSFTRMTPSSSHSSTAHRPPRLPDGPATGLSGSLLQDRLRERKVESARQARRRRSVDLTPQGAVRSSPMLGWEACGPGASALSPAKGMGMGVKQAEEQASILHKQNFDLKLELYHRRQRQEILEAKVEELEKREEQLHELRDINDELLAELQRRDQAVEEAVEMIFHLEQKVNKLTEDRANVKAFEADYEAGYVPPARDFSSSPPQFDQDSLPVSRRLARMPSFLSETTEGNEALRSLYFPFHGHSDTTLPQLAEEESPPGLDSPRLSVLSESSFVSVYGNKKVPALSLADEAEPRPRPRVSSSVAKWVEARPAPAVTPVRAASASHRSQFLSINDVLESPLQRLEKLKHSLDQTQAATRHLALTEKRRFRAHCRVSTDHSGFEGEPMLPPTPDTLGTNTLRNLRGSNETLYQNHAMDAFPPHPFQSQLSIRPRSAGETITSRRDGHGWDTPHDDSTDVCSVDSTLSGFSASASYTRRQHSVAPDLFTFGGGDWGRDYRRPSLPSRATSRYESLRGASVAEHPRSDDTVVKYNTNCYDDLPRYGSSPIDTSTKPELPDRRSSLSAVTKLKCPKPVGPEPPGHGMPHDSPAGATPKKSRIPHLRIFGRGDPAPAPSPTPASRPPHALRPTGLHQRRGSAHYSNEQLTSEEREQACATPPPIRRSRAPPSHYAAEPVARQLGGPDRAGGEEGAPWGGHAKKESVSCKSGEESGAAPTNEVAGGEGEGKSRRWFGLGVGRNNSVKKL